MEKGKCGTAKPKGQGNGLDSKTTMEHSQNKQIDELFPKLRQLKFRFNFTLDTLVRK